MLKPLRVGSGYPAVLVVALLAAACSAPSLEDNLASARESLEEADFASASIYLRNALRADSTNADARRLMAETELALGNIPAARDHLEWLRDSGAPPEAYAITLARVYVDLGAPDRAESLLAEPGMARPEESAYWLVLADARIMLGNPEGALQVIEGAAAAGASEAEIAFRRALVAYVRQDFDEAVGFVNAALDENADFAAALALRGNLAEISGDAAAARLDFERAAELFIAENRGDRAVPLYLALVESQLSTDDLALAEGTVASLAALAPGLPATRYAAALVAYRAGRFEDAVGALRTALTQLPDEPRFQALLGASHLALENLGQAEQEFVSVLSRDRANSAMLRLLLETRLRQDRPEAALDALRAYSPAFDNDDFGLVVLGARAAFLTGDFAAAIPLLERAIELSPDDQAIALQLVEANLRAGNADAVEVAVQRASSLGGDVELQANLVVLLARIQAEGLDAAGLFVQQLLDTGPQSANAALVSAFYQQLSGNVDAALAETRRALGLDPSLVAAHMLEGTLLQRRGESDSAAESYDRAIVLAPDNAAALSARATTAAAAQDFATAAALFERAYAIREEWGALANLTITRRLSGNVDWDAPLNNWLAENATDVRAWLFLAAQYTAAGRNVAAVAAYEAVIAEDADHFGALNNAAVLGAEIDGSRALEFARRAAELAPDNGAVMDTLGWILVQQSQASEGRDFLVRATQLLPEEAEIQYHLAVAYERTGDKESARQILDRLQSIEATAEIRQQAERLRNSL